MVSNIELYECSTTYLLEHGCKLKIAIHGDGVGIFVKDNDGCWLLCYTDDCFANAISSLRLGSIKNVTRVMEGGVIYLQVGAL